MKHIVGIDPGLTGAIAVIDLNNEVLAVHDMPITQTRVKNKLRRKIQETELSNILRRIDAQKVYVERVSAMPGQGVTSMFNFGYGFGLVLGVLAALEKPFELVSPRKWQHAINSLEGKEGHRARAAELYPDYADLFKRKKDDGRADAALIAAYGLMSSKILPEVYDT